MAFTTFEFWLIFNVFLAILIWCKLKQHPLPNQYSSFAAKRKLYLKIILACLLFTTPTFAGCTEWNLPFPWPFNHIGSIGGFVILVPALLLKHVFPDYLKNETYRRYIFKYFSFWFLFIFFGPIILGGGKALWKALL